MAKTIAILTGGGDCPGLNAVIRGVVRAAVLKKGWKVLGSRTGSMAWSGISGCANSTSIRSAGFCPGGTILGTSNRGNPFQYPLRSGKKTKLVDVSAQVVENFHRHWSRSAGGGWRRRHATDCPQAQRPGTSGSRRSQNHRQRPSRHRRYLRLQYCRRHRYRGPGSFA